MYIQKENSHRKYTLKKVSNTVRIVLRLKKERRPSEDASLKLPYVVSYLCIYICVCVCVCVCEDASLKLPYVVSYLCIYICVCVCVCV